MLPNHPSGAQGSWYSVQMFSSSKPPFTSRFCEEDKSGNANAKNKINDFLTYMNNIFNEELEKQNINDIYKSFFQKNMYVVEDVIEYTPQEEDETPNP